MSYDPRISHYRRSHAPRRLYLPADLTIASMHRNYIEKGRQSSYELYRKEITKKNISFATLGKEECETCLTYQEHKCVDANDFDSASLEEGSRSFNDKDIPFSHEKVNDCCDICTSYEEHKFKDVNWHITDK